MQRNIMQTKHTQGAMQQIVSSNMVPKIDNDLKQFDREILL